jgi:hypothetical protein
MLGTAHTDDTVNNILNLTMTTRNKHHYPGVKWVRTKKRYEATIPILGVPVPLGYYLSGAESAY